MSEQGLVKLEVDERMVRGIVEDQVRAGVMAALGQKTQIVESVVAIALSQKVDRNGVPTNSTYDGLPFLKWAVDKAIREATAKAIGDWLEQHQAVLKEAIVRELKKSPEKVAGTLVASLVGDANLKEFRLGVSVTLEPKGTR